MRFESIYKNKKVFVTGHTGFKGSWLISWLHLLGAEIKGYALPPENNSGLYNLVNGNSICNSVMADIREAEGLKKEILQFQPDFIFHLAAQPLVRLSYEIPLDTFSVNAIGTANVLDALRWLDKPCVAVLITTDKVYHNQERDYYYKEEDRLGGYDPYSASKAAAEIIIDSYRNSFFNPAKYTKHQKSIAVARAGNVIGGGDWAKDRIIPDIVRAISNNTVIQVRNPAAVRPWQHVLEPLSGYLLLAAKLTDDPVQYAAAYNFGPYPIDNLSVQQIVDAAIDIWGKGEFHQPMYTGAVHEAGLLQLNIDKAKTELGWIPKYKANTAIEKTLDWYKEFAVNVNEIDAFTFNQIKEYNAGI